jgi:DNA-binding GntR family transcriptional regulator
MDAACRSGEHGQAAARHLGYPELKMKRTAAKPARKQTVRRKPERNAEEVDTTLSQKAYERLQSDILKGYFGSGGPLRLEVLKDRYGLSFSPLREALNRLQSERLVVASALRGFRVAELSREEMWDCIETRILIEGEALRRSIERGGDDWEGTVMGTFHTLSSCAKRLTTLGRKRTEAEDDELERRHRDFHASLVSACGSRRLIDLSAQLYAQTERYRRPLLGLQAWSSGRNIYAEHEAIMKTVIERDAGKSIELLSAHYRKTGEIIEQNFDAAA